MPEKNNPAEMPPRPIPSGEPPEREADLDRIADDAAKRAGKTERRYDGQHDIFQK